MVYHGLSHYYFHFWNHNNTYIYISTYICIVYMCTYIYTIIFSHWNSQATSCAAALKSCVVNRGWDLLAEILETENAKGPGGTGGATERLHLCPKNCWFPWDMLWYVLWSRKISDDILSPEILWYVMTYCLISIYEWEMNIYECQLFWCETGGRPCRSKKIRTTLSRVDWRCRREPSWRKSTSWRSVCLIVC